MIVKENGTIYETCMSKIKGKNLGPAQRHQQISVDKSKWLSWMNAQPQEKGMHGVD